MRLKIFYRFLFTSFFLVVLFFFACSQGKPDSLVQNGGISPDVAPLPGIFPHAENWADPSTHGLWVVQNNPAPCYTCHSADSTAPGGPPACRSCHAMYPHSENWGQKENHGNFVLTNGREGCATQCHGTDLAGGLSEVSCTSCHTIYPHLDSNWREPEQHGETARTAPRRSSICRGCHGDDLRGGDSNVSCTSCHANYPHAEGWSSRENHGNFVLTNGREGCATQCHGTDLAGGLSEVSCTSCHAVYPHADNWREDHGASALEAGMEICSSCHGEDFRESLGGQNCYSCHTSYPHVAGWRNPEGEQGHGNFLRERDWDLTECRTCHGNDYLGRNEAPSCKSCHASFPHDSPGWATSSGHPAYISTTLMGDKSSCGLCHGDDFSGGSSGVSCTSCHDEFTHTDPGWVTGGTGRAGNVHSTTFVSLVNAGVTTACQECHGADYARAVGPSAKRCTNTACHPDGVTHRAGWSTGSADSGHGKYFSTTRGFNSESLAFCSDCHGYPDMAVIFCNSDSRDILSATSDCYDCHFAYPHKEYEATHSTETWLEEWLPATRPGNRVAHVLYLLRSPLVTDDSDFRPPVSPLSALNNPAWPGAIGHTCGGSTEGSCHFGGYRSNPTDAETVACGQYCHNTSGAVGPFPDAHPTGTNCLFCHSIH